MRVVNDFLANNLKICMMDTERNHGEMVHFRSRGDETLLPLRLFPIAVARYNNDLRPIVDVTRGTPYIAFIRETAVSIAPDERELRRFARCDTFLTPRSR